MIAIILALFTTTAFALTDVERAEFISRNLLLNGGGELGVREWSGGTASPTHTTAYDDVGSGKGAIVWDASGSGDDLVHEAMNVPAGLRGNIGVARCKFKTDSGTATHKLQVTNRSAILAQDDITSSDKFQASSVYFSFEEASGDAQLRIVAQADEPEIEIDDCYLGPAEGAGLSEVSQAEIVGIAYDYGNTNCAWSTTSTSRASFAADSDCNDPTTSGSASAPSTKIPAISFSNLGPGKYKVTARFHGQVNDTSATAQFALSDGTTDGENMQYVFNSVNQRQLQLEHVFEYSTAQTDVTFEIKGQATASDTTTITTTSTNRDLYFIVERFPTASQTAFNFDSVNWKVEASIDSSSGPSLGTADVTSYTEITGSGMSLTNHTDKGSDSSVQIACSSTEAPSGTTCTGDESFGISFIIPRAGLYEVCASFAHQFNSSSGTNDATFQLMETPTNAQTISQEGGGMKTTRSSISGNIGFPVHTCGTFKFDSVGRKLVRVMYEQNENVTLTNSALLINSSDTNAGNREAFFTVRPQDVQYPAPVVNNSVTTHNDSPMYIFSAIVNDGASGDCNSGSCTIERELGGDWLTSATYSATGNYALVFSKFSNTPNCWANPDDNSGECFVTPSSSTAASMTCYNGSGSAAPRRFAIFCMGQR